MRPGERAPAGAIVLATISALALTVWAFGGTSTAGAPLAAPPVVRTRLALDSLGDAALHWHETFGCSGCHKQAATLAALGAARTNGYEDARPGVVDALLTELLDGSSGQAPDGCFSLRGMSSFTVATTLGARGLEAYDRAFSGDHRSNLLDAADCLLGRSEPDGSLVSDHTELPVAQGSFITTAHGVFVWTRAHERMGTAAYGTAAADAAAWLRSEIDAIEAAPSSFTTQDKAMTLAGLGAAGAGPADPDVVRLRDLLAAEQLADGSWKLRDGTGGGNGYATGQVVFALRSAGFGPGEAAVEAGTDWLLENQLTDGSWPPDFWEGNNPSAVAPSMWAALALASDPSPLAGLRVDGGTSGILSWPAIEGADSYDVVRGVTSSLVELEDRTDLGEVACIAEATEFTSEADGTPPAPGECFFYVLRLRWGGNRDIYGRSSNGLDREASTGDCP